MVDRLSILNVALYSLLIGCSAGQAPAQSQERASVTQVFNLNDSNNDKCLSLDEWERMARAATEAVKNESSNSEQFMAWIMDTFSEIDSDRDKCVSSSEYMQSSEKSRIVGTQAR